MFDVLSPFSVDPIQTRQGSFVYTIKNPCVDTNFVSITAPVTELSEETYIVAATAQPWSPYIGNFIVSTNPVTHTLCG